MSRKTRKEEEEVPKIPNDYFKTAKEDWRTMDGTTILHANLGTWYVGVKDTKYMVQVNSEVAVWLIGTVPLIPDGEWKKRTMDAELGDGGMDMSRDWRTWRLKGVKPA